jgi:peptidoglycan/xylan/chitin deacetylase (PgdA/CDA1 family)
MFEISPLAKSLTRRALTGPPDETQLVLSMALVAIITNKQMKIDSIKNMSFAAYYGLSQPYRRWANWRMRAKGKAPVVILFYHRIADDAATPWTHSFALFRQQMDWLQANCDLVSLEEAQRRIRSGQNRRIATSITFDDGYGDNCDRAIPYLIEQRIPCTYFVSVRNVTERQPFFHDLKLGVSCRPNSIEQLRWMARQGVEIAAHTRTHADLGSIDDQVLLHDEVVTAGEELQSAIGHPVRYFSFPYGLPANLNLRAVHLAYEHGYEAVCSAYGDYNFPGDDPFHLRRVHAENMLRLKNWLTIDPRKMRASYTLEDYRDSPRQELAAVAQ